MVWNLDFISEEDFGTLSGTTQPSRLIMMPRGLKAGLTTMHLGTVPASLSESSGRCSLTK